MIPSLKGRRALVVGLGKSGAAAAKLLLSIGAKVSATDEKPKSDLAAVVGDLPLAVEVEAGNNKFLDRDWDLIVVSPGVPKNHPGLAAARTKGTPVWPELELAWRCVNPKRTIAITGTNGKTTTTALTAHILEKAGLPVVVGGNIGTPLSALVPTVNGETYLVLEVSSYQLEYHETFHPNVGVFTNLTPDHMARHGSMEGYAAAKARLFDLFEKDDTAVLNRNDAWCKKVGKVLKSRIDWFPSADLKALASVTPLPGAHNLENAMAAAAAARAVGVGDADIRAGIRTFQGVRHRIQIVRERRGVIWVNDSKSTNVDSTLVALKSFRQPLWLILGGQHKGAPYTPLKKFIKGKVREILTIGESAPIIADDLKGAAPITPCGTLDRAVAHAAEKAGKGEVVLLSPACASFDQFRNFEDRGDQFVSLVEALPR